MQYCLRQTASKKPDILILSCTITRCSFNVVAAAFGTKVNPVKRAIGMTFARILPKLLIGSGLNLDNLSHDPNVIRVYKSDPNVHTKISLGTGTTKCSLCTLIASKIGDFVSKDFDSQTGNNIG